MIIAQTPLSPKPTRLRADGRLSACKSSSPGRCFCIVISKVTMRAGCGPFLRKDMVNRDRAGLHCLLPREFAVTLRDHRQLRSFSAAQTNPMAMPL